MNMYYVTIPCTMAVCVTVEAENEEAAKDAALHEASWWVDVSADDDCAPEVLEMETHRQIVEGNIFHGAINEIEVEEAL